MSWYSLVCLKDIAQESCQSFVVAGLRLAVYYDGECYYAFEDNCPHQNLPLADGEIEHATITCPYHQAKFCLKSGKVLQAPAQTGIHIFPTRVTAEQGLEVWVDEETAC